MLAIIKMFEKWLNFFSLALKSKVTSDKVMPAKSNNRNGQNLVIIPAVKYETAKPQTASIRVKNNKLRTNRFTNSFMLI
jgi:hypothetical protein